QAVRATETVPAGRVLALDDVVGSRFGYAHSVGELTILGTDTSFLTTSRAYTAGDNGTFGQFLPGMASADALGPGETHTAAAPVPPHRGVERGAGIPGAGPAAGACGGGLAARDHDALGARDRGRPRDRHRRRPGPRRDAQLPRGLRGGRARRQGRSLRDADRR